MDKHEITGTPEEVDLVATEVMKWRKVNMPWGVTVWQDEEGKNHGSIGSWNPFKSWDDAGKVWKRLRELDFVLRIYDGKERVMCEAFRGAFTTTIYAEAEDVPTALCRAALLTTLEE